MSSNYEKNFKYTSRVTFEVIIENSGGNWEGECSLGQLHEQAIKAARGTIASLLSPQATASQRHVAARVTSPGKVVSVEVLPIKK